jgi:cytochrome c biogenesis protein CcmG, thiol:disulfide interchange protein DsbE
LNQPEATIQEGLEQSRPHWGRFIAWGALLVLLVVIALSMARNQQGPVRLGQRVPNFTLTSFQGEKYSLADLKGKVVLVNFWASWCNPCEQEAADLETAWRYYQPRGDVVFLGVDYVDTEPEAKGYLDKFNITYVNGPDLRTSVSQAFRIRGVPETYIIDREGRLAKFQIGPYNSLADIKAMIDPLLNP